MTRFLLDTDTFSHYLWDHPGVFHNIARHLSDVLAVTIITVEELWTGWAAAIAKARKPDQIAATFDRLTATINELRNWPVVSFSLRAVERYAALKKMKLNVGANDLRIAAIAIELGAVVVTRNTRDFSRIPGVQFVDWVGT